MNMEHETDCAQELVNTYDDSKSSHPDPKQLHDVVKGTESFLTRSCDH